jgi:hypothetical protein
MKEAHDHHRVTPEGKMLGQQMVRLHDLAVRRLALRVELEERCQTCAFRPGTVPNGCAQTQLDISKCVAEGIPFHCHQNIGQLCAGWATCYIGLGDILPPAFAASTKDQKLSPPDSQFHIVQAAEAKRERRAEKRRQLAAKNTPQEA